MSPSAISLVGSDAAACSTSSGACRISLAALAPEPEGLPTSAICEAVAAVI